MNPISDELIALSPHAPDPRQNPTPYGQSTVIPELHGHRNLAVLRNITQPALTVHRPEPGRATGTAVIVCPGGSFITLTRSGTAIAAQLARQGITAFTLRYRLLPTPISDAQFVHDWGGHTMEEIKAHSRAPTLDARQAIGVVRARAAAEQLDPHRIGILGFSAGGLLALAAATGHDPATRPDFAAPIYPAIWHDYQVPGDAPPLFLCCAADDQGEQMVEKIIALHRNWRNAGRSVEMHIYERGGHGFAERAQGLPCDTWLDRYLDWTRSHGF
ncbi:alpha/beta hydrolase [Nocardia terpenica]|uniref:Alpha/beta hydrolase fold domain-containing protein n=1 Tax=Nocardia terpenica TaxID=455432 RepID=A0A6G9YZ53_9NOCA|nr:dienelactone hydrolase family protein [Nocardia terpenica]QIS18391.1 alpha/beta hydrolase fold domain-containing protein [Nocardia terpenica]